MANAALSRSKIPFSCNLNPKPYTACLQCKFTKLPFPIIASKSVVPFEVIHTDVWGPSPHVSLEGFRYYVLFIYECTRYTWIFPLMNKAGVFTVFVQFLAFVSNFFDAKVLQENGY